MTSKSIFILFFSLAGADGVLDIEERMGDVKRRYFVKKFGNTCILLASDKILEYGDVIDIIWADERKHIMERKEVPLFNQAAFREAITDRMNKKTIYI